MLGFHPTKSPHLALCLGLVETVGIEPTLKFTRLQTADGHAVLLDPEDAWLLTSPRWTWRLEASSPRSRRRYVVRHTSYGGRQVRIYLHRAVLGLVPGDPRRVDHVSGDTLDNRRANLRIVTDAQNAQNQGSRGGSSGYRGVSWDRSRGKWMASATLNGKRTTIGRFDSEDEAGAAAMAWRAQHMPFATERAGC